MPDEANKPQSLEVRGTVELRPAAIEERFDRIDKAFAELKKKKDGKDFWDIVQALSLPTLISGAVLAWLGWLLTGSVEQALQKQQLELAVVKEMQTLIVDMENPKLPRNDVTRKAAALAAYGYHAVPAFVNLLEIGKQMNSGYTAVGAEEGLRMVGATTPRPVCLQLTGIIRNRSGRYNWQTHQSALQILGDLNCQNALVAIAEYQGDMKSTDIYSAWVAPPRVEKSEFNDMQELVEITRRRLASAPHPNWWRRFINTISRNEE